MAGHSLGGVIGMHLAAKEPALVRKLLIVDLRFSFGRA